MQERRQREASGPQGGVGNVLGAARRTFGASGSSSQMKQPPISSFGAGRTLGQRPRDSLPGEGEGLGHQVGIKRKLDDEEPQEEAVGDDEDPSEGRKGKKQREDID